MLLGLNVLLVICISLTEQRNIRLNKIDKLPSKVYTDFDYLVFRQIWPQSTCMFPGHHSCSIGRNVTSWVVHGLW